MNRKIVIISSSDDIYLNLAAEEYCLHNLTPEFNILYLWQSRNTVVIGKHQNPGNECDFELLKEFSIKLARRISGGGAVYQDPGNLNYSFISARENYNRDLNFTVVTGALQYLGISTQVTAAYDLVCNQKKISGNAFYYTGRAVLHHGTLLVNSNLDLLYRVLAAKAAGGNDHSVVSRKSAVINLTQIKQNLTLRAIKEALIKAFKKIQGPDAAVCPWSDFLSMGAIIPYLRRQRSPEWIFGFPRKKELHIDDRVLLDA